MSLEVPGFGYTKSFPTDRIRGVLVNRPTEDLPVFAGGDSGRVGDFDESKGRYRTREDYINPDARPSIPRPVNRPKPDLKAFEALLNRLSQSRQR